MIRGTNAQFKFKMPYKFSELLVAEVTFWQEGNDGTMERPLPIVKVLDQCTETADEYELSVALNQEETLRFSDDLKAYVQLRAKVRDGNTFASRQTRITVYPIYDDSILGDEITPTPGYDGWYILDGGEIV